MLADLSGCLGTFAYLASIHIMITRHHQQPVTGKALWQLWPKLLPEPSVGERVFLSFAGKSQIAS